MCGCVCVMCDVCDVRCVRCVMCDVCHLGFGNIPSQHVLTQEYSLPTPCLS